MNGKGDTYRPVDDKQFEDNFNNIDWSDKPDMIIIDDPQTRGKCIDCQNMVAREYDRGVHGHCEAIDMSVGGSDSCEANFEPIK